MSGWGVALLTTIALFASTAKAGTEAAPEVTDATGDGHLDCTTGLPTDALPACATIPSQDSIDIAKLWIVDVSPTAFEVHLALTGAPNFGAGVGTDTPLGCAQVAGTIQYYALFNALNPAGVALVTTDPGSKNPQESAYVVASLNCDTATKQLEPDFSWGALETDTTSGSNFNNEGSVAGAVVGNSIVWTVPRNIATVALPEGAAANGYSLGGLYAQSGVTPRVVAGLVFSADRAPDTGFGSSFVFGSAASAAKPIYSDLTTAAFTLAAKNPAPTNQTYVYNWTNAQADVDVTFGAAARAGTAHVVVKDSSNTTVLDKTFPPAANGSFELPSAKTGKWQVTVTYAGFTGDVMLSIAKHQSTSTATPTPTHTTGPAPTQTTTAAGTSTSSAAPTGAPSATTTTKGTPGVGLLLLLAALGAGVAIRRRL